MDYSRPPELLAVIIVRPYSYSFLLGIDKSLPTHGCRILLGLILVPQGHA